MEREINYINNKIAVLEDRLDIIWAASALSSNATRDAIATKRELSILESILNVLTEYSINK